MSADRNNAVRAARYFQHDVVLRRVATDGLGQERRADLGLNPIMTLGAKFGVATVAFEQFWVRIFTEIYLHAGFVQLREELLQDTVM